MTVLAPLVRREPIMTVHAGLSTAVISYLAFAQHFTPAEMAAAATITAAVTAIVSAFLTAPVDLGTIHVGLVTGLVASAAFGLHLTPEATGFTASAIIVLLGYLMREKLTPVVGTQL
jgi:hypothetical protein